MVKNNKRKYVISSLFDIRPITASGDLDMSKIKVAGRILDLRGLRTKQENITRRKAVKVEQSEDSFIRTGSGLTAAEQLVSDRLEADLGLVKSVAEKIKEEQGFEKQIVPSKKINRFKVDINLIEKEKKLEQSSMLITEADLLKLEQEFEDEKLVETETEETVEQKKPALVKNDNEYEFPTKEEILAELENIENNNNIISDGNLVFGKEDKLLKKEHGKLSELERIYLGDDEIVKDKITKTDNNDKDIDNNIDLFKDMPFVHSEQEWHSNLAIKRDNESKQHPVRSFIGFIATGILIALIIPGATLLSKGFSIKDEAMSNSMVAVQNLLDAKDSIEQTNWQDAEQNFSLANQSFFQAHQEISKLGQMTIGILERLPGGSLISSGNHLIKVGENLAEAGQGLSSAMSSFSFTNWFDMIELPDTEKENIIEKDSLTDLLNLSQNDLAGALHKIRLANNELGYVEVESLPFDIQEKVLELKKKLPIVEKLLDGASVYSEALMGILGSDNPRQYLLIFQNNSEIRATGGFIGTYGLLKLYKGQIRELFIDGVFNADGQLHEKIIPPKPIQKISTAWSMHDANWFADFPNSADKISWFYEKTGGPTVDGVISFTPVVIERLLRLTGSIDMPEYEITLTADNFVELVQQKVEVDFDKELNRPKKILADFTPKFVEKLNQLSSQEQKQAAEIIINCLAEKHILFYFKDENLEDFIINEGWAGQILETDKDYLSVVSSNINGFKTDRVIKETINHQAEIQEDGSIIDTLSIIRKHDGGDMDYDWWNRVNANYLRVYLPLGSELISAEGQSLEIYNPPIDYQKNNFKKDLLVSSIEENMIVDKESGTQIFTENNKTVFGNWVYVSPGETSVLTYKYKLPFKIDLTKSTDSYSLLAQKQSGSIGSKFIHGLNYPDGWKISWQYPDKLIEDLIQDRFSGTAFSF
ncbi:DUF4012 domain-containing protein [Patescibacteria group bacterium]